MIENTEPTILGPEEVESLRALQTHARARLQGDRDRSALPQSNPFDAWTNSKSPYTDEELAMMQRRDRTQEARSIRSRLPGYFATTSPEELFRKVTAPAFVEVANNWTPKASGNLLLLGETGQCKSATMACIFYRLLRSAWYNGGDEWAFAQHFQWVRADELEREMQAHPHGRGHCPLYLAAAGASLLFLDDLGWEKDPAKLAGLIGDRYDHSRQTIVTSALTASNLDERGQTVPGELPRRYSEAVFRKLMTYRDRPVRIRSSFPSRKEEVERRPRPPGDQKEQARRLGETL